MRPVVQMRRRGLQVRAKRTGSERGFAAPKRCNVQRLTAREAPLVDEDEPGELFEHLRLAPLLHGVWLCSAGFTVSAQADEALDSVPVISRDSAPARES